MDDLLPQAAPQRPDHERVNEDHERDADQVTSRVALLACEIQAYGLLSRLAL